MLSLRARLVCASPFSARPTLLRLNFEPALPLYSPCIHDNELGDEEKEETNPDPCNQMPRNSSLTTRNTSRRGGSAARPWTPSESCRGAGGSASVRGRWFRKGGGGQRCRDGCLVGRGRERWGVLLLVRNFGEKGVWAWRFPPLMHGMARGGLGHGVEGSVWSLYPHIIPSYYAAPRSNHAATIQFNSIQFNQIHPEPLLWKQESLQGSYVCIYPSIYRPIQLDKDAS